MDNVERGLFTGMVVAGLIGLGRLLDSDEKITLRKAIARGLISTGLGAAGGLVLVLVPGIHPVAIISLAAGFASIGTSAIEAFLKKRVGGGE